MGEIIMKPEEYIKGSELCLKECELSNSSGFVTTRAANYAINMTRQEERKKATAAFRHFVVDYCGETGRTDISMAAGHHIKMFEDILNKEEQE